MMKKIITIMTCLLLAVCCCACQQASNPTPLVSTDDNAWYNPYEQSSAVEVSVADAIEHSENVAAKLAKYAKSADKSAINDLAAIEKELNAYSGGTSADSQYINALRKLLHCINGFCTYNSTESMLTAAIAEVNTTYGALSAQLQSTYYLPTEADIRATAANFAALADTL